MAVRAMDLTALVAVNFFGFLLRVIRSRVNHREHQRITEKIHPNRAAVTILLLLQILCVLCVLP